MNLEKIDTLGLYVCFDTFDGWSNQSGSLQDGCSDNEEGSLVVLAKPLLHEVSAKVSKGKVNEMQTDGKSN